MEVISNSNSSLNRLLTRAIILVVDGCGAGAAPDAAAFGDSQNCNTLVNVASSAGPLHLPNFEKLGLGNLDQIKGLTALKDVWALYGKLEESSCGKDTQTGHWEMMGVVSAKPFPTYPHGFPKEVIDQFVSATKCGGVLGNKTASGTEILEELGEEHRKTRYPIVYTSADSVFQIACNVHVIQLSTLYEWCQIARDVLTGPHRLGRVIARPFEGKPGAYTRLQGDRRDYGVPPPTVTLLDELKSRGIGVFGIGKIEDIFHGQGITHAKHTATNREGLELTLSAIHRNISYANNCSDTQNIRLIFTNLVDTDSLYGHRRDSRGYAKALTEIDEYLGRIMQAMSPTDLLIITSDHGNDPTMPGSDHTREYVPLLIYSSAFTKNEGRSNRNPDCGNAAILEATRSVGGHIARNVAGSAVAAINETNKRSGEAPPRLVLSNNLGTRKGFYDIAATVAEWLEVPYSFPGVSCLTRSKNEI